MVSRKALLSAAAKRRAEKGSVGRRKNTIPAQPPAVWPPRYEPADVVKLREELKLSQRAFGRAIGYSYQTVQKWEYAQRRVTKSAALLLTYIARYGIITR
jgi:DNA-binding transcriptional regulator YiaG